MGKLEGWDGVPKKIIAGMTPFFDGILSHLIFFLLLAWDEEKPDKILEPSC